MFMQARAGLFPNSLKRDELGNVVNQRQANGATTVPG